MVTGEVIVENTVAALRGGADDFIGKPLNLSELEYVIRMKWSRSCAAESWL